MTSKLHLPRAFTLALCAASAAGFALLTACGGRSLLEDIAETPDADQIPDAEQTPDAGLKATEDAGPVGVETSHTSSGADAETQIDVFAWVPDSSASPLGACASCIKTNCGTAINECVNDPQCVEGAACTIMQCSAGVVANVAAADIASTATDFLCVMNCFGGDIKAAIRITSDAICLTQTCSAFCSALVPSTIGGDASSTLGSITGLAAGSLGQTLLGTAGAGNTSFLGDLLDGLLSSDGGTHNTASRGSLGGLLSGSAGTRNAHTAGGAAQLAEVPGEAGTAQTESQN
jgi:hypothetical protein